MPDLHAPVVLIDEETDELLAVEREFGAKRVDAVIHVIRGIAPEIHENLLHLGSSGGDNDALAQHKRGRHFDDGEGQRVGVVRFIAEVVNFEVR